LSNHELFDIYQSGKHYYCRYNGKVSLLENFEENKDSFLIFIKNSISYMDSISKQLEDLNFETRKESDPILNSLCGNELIKEISYENFTVMFSVNKNHLIYFPNRIVFNGKNIKIPVKVSTKGNFTAMSVVYLDYGEKIDFDSIIEKVISKRIKKKGL